MDERQTGERLRQARAMRRVNQQDLGRILGVTGAQVSRIESGSRSLTVEEVVKICDALNIPRSWFYEDLLPAPFNMDTGSPNGGYANLAA